MSEVNKGLFAHILKLEQNQKYQEERIKEIERVLALEDFPTKQTFLKRIYGARNYRV